MTDGKIHLTTIPSDVLGAIFSTLHETAHRETTGRPVIQTDPKPPQGELTHNEQALYDAVVAELKARVVENGEGETRK